QRRASATSLAVIVGSSAAAATRLAGDGSVEFDTAAIVFLGAILGVWVGVRAAGIVPNRWLARAFVALMLASALRLAFLSSESTPSDPV
nr:sulfite exporter TauE/SafE family protein [Desulfuromonadales bacterium]